MITCPRCKKLKYDENTPCVCNMTPEYIVEIQNKLDSIDNKLNSLTSPQGLKPLSSKDRETIEKCLDDYKDWVEYGSKFRSFVKEFDRQDPDKYKYCPRQDAVDTGYKRYYELLSLCAKFAVPNNKDSEGIKKHFEANMLDGEDVKDCGKAMLSAEFVLEYLQEYYTVPNEGLSEETLALIKDYISDVEGGIRYLELNKQDYGYGKDRLREKSKSLLSALENKR